MLQMAEMSIEHWANSVRVRTENEPRRAAVGLEPTAQYGGKVLVKGQDADKMQVTEGEGSGKRYVPRTEAQRI
jgi:hypothetical protein